MKRITWIFILSLLAVEGMSQKKNRKAIFIIVDGISADVIEQQPVPNLKAIAAKGRYLRAWLGGEPGNYSQTPTISAVGYNSLLTGTWANKHNVWDNDIAAPNYHYPTIFKLFKEQYPQKKIAVFSSWLDNRTKLIGEGLQATGSFKMDYVADGYELDTVNFPHDRNRDFMERIDAKVAQEAAASISSKAPDLSWVYLEYTDDMGHMYGDSEQYHRAVKLMDEKIGLIWNAVKEREKKFGEEWLIFITTDHGRKAEDGKGHGGQSFRERNIWIVTNRPNVNAYANHYIPAITDIFPSIAHFMDIKIPVKVSRELDGQSLFGPAVITRMQAHYFQQKLDISWTPLNGKEMVKLYLSTSNQVKTGGNDEYVLLGTYHAGKGSAIVDLAKYPSGFYKVVLESAGTTLNRWVLVQKEN